MRKLSKVEAIEYVRTDWYYDFTVDVFSNYIMAGIVHHNSGKSFFVANLHNALIFDTDIGGGLAYAEARIKRNGSVRVEAGTYDEVLAELKERQRARLLQEITTLAIDHLSALHQGSTLKHNPTMERDFGRASDLATREWRRIREFCRNQDFNLICTSHLKAKWEHERVVGTQADGAKNLEGDVGIVLQVRRGTQYPSLAWVQKWRRDPEDQRGPIPTTFPFTLEAFEKLAGAGLSEPRKPAALATEAQVQRIKELLELVKLDDGTVEKWLKKAGAESFGEMLEDDVNKCIAFVEKKLASLNKGDQPHVGV